VCRSINTRTVTDVTLPLFRQLLSSALPLFRQFLTFRKFLECGFEFGCHGWVAVCVCGLNSGTVCTSGCFELARRLIRPGQASPRIALILGVLQVQLEVMNDLLPVAVLLEFGGQSEMGASVTRVACQQRLQRSNSIQTTSSPRTPDTVLSTSIWQVFLRPWN
jgi:hypothetical protein